MSEEPRRTRLDVIRELHALTKEMQSKREIAEFLILSVEKRQDLMDEYDLLKLRNLGEEPGEEEQAEIKRRVEEIIRMDGMITVALERHKEASKKDLVQSNNQNKVLGYVNQAISSSGSYMDYKK